MLNIGQDRPLSDARAFGAHPAKNHRRSRCRFPYDSATVCRWNAVRDRMQQSVRTARTGAGSMWPMAAGLIGNVLEWHDFAAYGFLAATFAANFFPLENHILSLAASYGVFAAAFVMRPLGGLLFGHIGDRVGRRAALII